MRVQTSRHWRTFIADVQRGLLDAGFEDDFFGLDDLLFLYRARYTAAMVVEHARQLGTKEAHQ